MERAGVNVVYGFAGLKIHAKLCLVVRREGAGMRRYVHIGTGNFNAASAKSYTDLGLFTTNQAICSDVQDLFNVMTGYGIVERYRALFVSPKLLRHNVSALIEEEIHLHETKGGGHIILKCNQLVDPDIIALLYKARRAGEKIECIVRGICCLRAGVPDETENIHIISIVGRYLEHSRIYIFGQGERARYYIGSADWMTRSTLRRVEIAAPVTAPALKARLQHIFDTMLADNCNARVQQPDGSYVRRMPGADAVDCQAQFYEEAYQANVHSSLK